VGVKSVDLLTLTVDKDLLRTTPANVRVHNKLRIVDYEMKEYLMVIYISHKFQFFMDFL
jgi:hypothetical protein